MPAIPRPRRQGGAAADVGGAETLPPRAHDGLFVFAFPVVLRFGMGKIFGTREDADLRMPTSTSRVDATDFYVPAYFALVAAPIGVIMLPAPLTDYRQGGVLRRFRAALVPMWTVLGAQVTAALVLAAPGRSARVPLRLAACTE